MGAETALDERQEFSAAIATLGVVLGRDLDAKHYDVYWFVLRDLPRQVRRQTMAEAVKRQWKFFPQPAELKAIGVTLLANQRREAFDRRMEHCPHEPKGWLEIEQGGVWRQARCPCWTAAMQAMETVGPALALPAVALAEVNE